MAGTALAVKCFITSAVIVVTGDDYKVIDGTVPSPGTGGVITWDKTEPAAHIDNAVYDSAIAGNILLTRTPDWAASTTENATPNAGIAKSTYDPASVAAGGLSCHGSWL